MKDVLSNLILFKDYEAVEKLMKDGVDPNLPLEHDKTGVEWASYTRDFQMMDILWKAGAIATTEFVEEIFLRFSNGERFQEMVEPKDDPTNYPDFTDSFTIRKVKFTTGTITVDENNLYEIEVKAEKFVLTGEVVDTFICLPDIKLIPGLQSQIGKVVNFPVNTDVGYIDGSMYMAHAHIPVDVMEIRFLKLENNHLTVEIDAEFLFEYEGTDYKNERTKILVNLMVSK